MSYSKKEEFKEREVFLADIAKALSHPARLLILKLLTKKNVCMCGEIVDLLPLSQSTVSQHLKELKRTGLIIGEIEGPKTCYCVDKKGLAKAKKEFDTFFKQISEEEQ